MKKLFCKTIDFLYNHLAWVLLLGLCLIIAGLAIGNYNSQWAFVIFIIGVSVCLLFLTAIGTLNNRCVQPNFNHNALNIPNGFPEDVLWKGLGDEPKWDGEIKPVTDYTVPRYVYANGIESETPQKQNGQVVGYRISSTLVIHNMVAGGNGWFSEHIRPFITRYGGQLLNAEDVAVLRKNYQAVDKMRKKIGDKKLPRRFWYKSSYGNNVAFLEEEKDEYDPDSSGIILKR